MNAYVNRMWYSFNNSNDIVKEVVKAFLKKFRCELISISVHIICMKSLMEVTYVQAVVVALHFLYFKLVNCISSVCNVLFPAITNCLHNWGLLI